MNKEMIPLSVPNLKGRELEYLKIAIDTEWVSANGPFVNRFEETLATYVKSKAATSIQSGTAGLHVSLQVCGVTKDDEVIVPTLTFIAAVNPVKYLGAEPIFMDCDDSLTLDPNKLEEFCAIECIFKDGKLINKITQRHIKAVVVVHVFGNMANMEKIIDVATRYNLKVIEDATEALGTYYRSGKYKGKYAGTLGDIGVYSFNGNKIITTGSGGMIVSDNEELIRLAKHLSTQAKIDEIYYFHDMIGYNYRMTNIQAAIGLAQLEQIEMFIKIKEENYYKYKDTLKIHTLLDFKEEIRPNYWFYSLLVDSNYTYSRDALINYLHEKRVQTRPIWGLIHEQMPYLNSQSYKIEKAKEYQKKIINLPCSSSLNTADILYVVKCLEQVTQ